MLPNVTGADVIEPYRADLAALGWDVEVAELRVTDGGTDATHLAVYLVPTEDRSGDEFADALPVTLGAIARDAFDRWPALTSLDVCQVAFGTGGDRGAALDTMTAVWLSEEQARAFDWDSITLIDVLTPGAATSYGVAPAVRDSSTFTAALAAATDGDA